MIYIIITCCLLDRNKEIRRNQYINSITNLINYCKNKDNIQFVLVENTGKRNSYLDDFKLPVLYTNSNSINTINKGIKELTDVKLCINHFNVKDDDFVVKITGRYLISNPCAFLDKLEHIDKYDCIIRYGSYLGNAKLEKTEDCISGIIGMRCRNVKNVVMPVEGECVEWMWARESMKIPDEKVCILPELGLYIAPDCDRFFRV